MGMGFFCAVSKRGVRVECWLTQVPSNVAHTRGWLKVSCGYSHVCAVTKMFCWGDLFAAGMDRKPLGVHRDGARDITGMFEPFVDDYLVANRTNVRFAYRKLDQERAEKVFECDHEVEKHCGKHGRPCAYFVSMKSLDKKIHLYFIVERNQNCGTSKTCSFRENV
mmetsp:Transcript_67392/g.213321  ORF Transcript_67392/g.213321 Transcript_67392/m.213321 type:complete len:165 (+) Transcript_67392:697-1191(+)